MERLSGRLAVCIAIVSVSLLSGCVVPIPAPLPKPDRIVTQVPIVPVQPVVTPVVAPVVPRISPPPVVPPPVVPVNNCNIFGTDCPVQDGDGGGDGGGVWD